MAEKNFNGFGPSLCLARLARGLARALPKHTTQYLAREGSCQGICALVALRKPAVVYSTRGSYLSFDTIIVLGRSRDS
jgi:hypothetical protein